MEAIAIDRRAGAKLSSMERRRMKKITKKRIAIFEKKDKGDSDEEEVICKDCSPFSKFIESSTDLTVKDDYRYLNATYVTPVHFKAIKIITNMTITVAISITFMTTLITDFNVLLYDTELLTASKSVLLHSMSSPSHIIIFTFPFDTRSYSMHLRMLGDKNCILC